MKFDKNYWLEQLKKEVGLETVPYEELHLHFVDFSSPFGNSVEKVNAKQYVDDQLSIISSQYEEFEALNSLIKLYINFVNQAIMNSIYLKYSWFVLFRIQHSYWILLYIRI